MRRTAWITPAVALAVLCLPGRAATTREDLIRRMRAWQTAVRESIQLMQDKKYDQAVVKLNEADKLIPRRPVVHYNLACALSLSGKKEEALDALERSIEFGYVDHDHMQADKDLAPIRDTDRFKKLAARTKRKAKGLPPLIHVPTGYDEKGTRTYPLFVSLHGAGGTPRGLFNAAKQILGPDKYFVLAPCGSAPVGPGFTWNSLDFRKVPGEIDRLKKKYRIGKVYLYGFSAGAHVGYILVLKCRDRFDGFIPMAGALRRRMITDDDLKKAGGLPIYAIQGEADPVVPLRAAEQSLAILKKHGALTHLCKHPGAHRAPKDFAKVLREAVRWIEAQKAGDR